MISLIGGELDFVITGLPECLPHVKSGRLRALAIASSARHPFIPDIQTTAELGLPSLTITSWTGLMVPSATPKDIVARINAEVASVLKQPDTATRARAGLRHRGELGGSRAKLHGGRSRALGQARAGREYQSRLEKQ